jgi:hypothetical protein
MKTVNIVFIILLLFFLLFLADDLKIKYFIQKDFRGVQWIIWSILGLYFITNSLDLHIYGFIILFYIFYHSTIFYNKVMEYSFIQSVLPNSFFEYQEKVEQYYQNLDNIQEENKEREREQEQNRNEIEFNKRNKMNKNREEVDFNDENRVLSREDIIESLQKVVKNNTQNIKNPQKEIINEIETNDDDREQIQKILNESFNIQSSESNTIPNLDPDIQKKLFQSTSIAEMPNTIMSEMSQRNLMSL